MTDSTMYVVTSADNGAVLVIDERPGFVIDAFRFKPGDSFRISNDSQETYVNGLIWSNFGETKLDNGINPPKDKSWPLNMPTGALYRFDISARAEGDLKLLITIEASGGGGGGGVDAVARAKLDQIFPAPGKSVSSGSTVSIQTTDAGIVEVKNPTINPVPVPANPTKADLLAAGLVQDTPSAVSVPTEYSKIATADGAQSLTPAKFDNTKPVTVRINGLEQDKASYTVTLTGVDLPADLNIRVNDEITVVYYQTA